MKIVTQSTVGDPDVLQVTTAEDPVPGPGEVLVRVAATSVNPVDTAVRAGAFPLLGDPPFVLGWDLAGTVEAVGEGVETFVVGDRVAGLSRFPGEGAANAELAVASADELVATPDVLTDAEAAALPLAALTAWQGLHAADLAQGHRVLVQAAGGGVGHLAVQIAKAAGAHVVATASTAKVDTVRSLGADEVVDYTTTDRSTIDPVDIVLDPFGGEETSAVADLVRRGGAVVSLLPPSDGAVPVLESRGLRHVQVDVRPSARELVEIMHLVETGDLRPVVSQTFPLERLAEAHAAVGTGSTLGKVVVTVG